MRKMKALTWVFIDKLLCNSVGINVSEFGIYNKFQSLSCLSNPVFLKLSSLLQLKN